MGEQYVEYSQSQVATLIGPERKYRTNGYRIIPCNNGLGDGWGMSVWVDRIRPVEVETWLPCIGWAGEYRWHYDPHGNTWTKEYRKAEAAVPPQAA
jgi:hypothetical protein